MSVFKGRHEFNRNIRRGKKQVKIFPAGGDPMILTRKISLHGVIQKEKVVLRYRCKSQHVLSESSDSGSGSESSANADSQLESLAGPEIPSEKPSSLPSQENSSVTQKARLICRRLLLVSQKLI